MIVRFFVEVIVNVPAVVRLSATNHHRFAAAACSPRRPQRSGVVAVRISPHGESPDVVGRVFEACCVGRILESDRRCARGRVVVAAASAIKGSFAQETDL